MSVTDIEEGTDEYDEARKAVLADKLAKDGAVDISGFNLAALDISILNPEGDEIEPEAAVTVDIRIKSLPGVDDLSEVVDTLEVQHHVETENGVIVETVFDGEIEGSFTQETDAKVIE